MGMTMGNRRMGTMARGLLVVAALALLPLAGLLPGQGPRRAEAQAAAQDSLWAGVGLTYGACANPSSPASLAGCFSAPASIGTGDIDAVATDGVNVYFATAQNGGYSCPIADQGANCTHIMAGAWSSGKVKSLAASGGYLWIGQDNGQIYRCAANLPYGNQGSMPSGCALLDNAGQRSVDSLLLANGRLYAGLASYGNSSGKQGILWSCDPDTVNACENLDEYGNTTANSLAAGGGYLWAGLKNGIIWRCDLNAANACATWGSSSGSWVSGVSYDGQGTLYASLEGTQGVIWACATAAANQCSNVRQNVYGMAVAAGAGGVFYSTTYSVNYGTSTFTAASSNLAEADLVYIPAGGVSGVGGVSVTLQGGKWADKLGKRCAKGGKGLRGSVQVTGPGGHDKTVAVNLCALAKGGSVKETFDLLDPGTYTVKAATMNWKKRFGGSVSVTVQPDQTGAVKVRLKGLHR